MLSSTVGATACDDAFADPIDDGHDDSELCGALDGALDDPPPPLPAPVEAAETPRGGLSFSSDDEGAAATAPAADAPRASGARGSEKSAVRLVRELSCGLRLDGGAAAPRRRASSVGDELALGRAHGRGPHPRPAPPVLPSRPAPAPPPASPLCRAFEVYLKAGPPGCKRKTHHVITLPPVLRPPGMVPHKLPLGHTPTAYCANKITAALEWDRHETSLGRLTTPRQGEVYQKVQVERVRAWVRSLEDHTIDMLAELLEDPPASLQEWASANHRHHADYHAHQERDRRLVELRGPRGLPSRTMAEHVGALPSANIDGAFSELSKRAARVVAAAAAIQIGAPGSLPALCGAVERAVGEAEETRAARLAAEAETADAHVREELGDAADGAAADRGCDGVALRPRAAYTVDSLVAEGSRYACAWPHGVAFSALGVVDRTEALARGRPWRAPRDDDELAAAFGGADLCAGIGCGQLSVLLAMGVAFAVSVESAEVKIPIALAIFAATLARARRGAARAAGGTCNDQLLWRRIAGACDRILCGAEHAIEPGDVYDPRAVTERLYDTRRGVRSVLTMLAPSCKPYGASNQ